MSHYSYTRIKAWNECPLSYRLQYIDGVGKEESDALVLGAASHDFFQLYVEEINKVPRKPDNLLMMEAWTKEARDQSLFDEYQKVCLSFIEKFNPEDILKDSQTVCELGIALDKDFKPVDWDSEIVLFRAKIDRLDIQGTKAKVTDYKTGFSGKADQWQTSLYAWALTKIYPEITEFEVVLHYTRSGWQEKSSFTKEKLGAVEFQLKSVIEAIENDKKFKAKPGNRCSSCFVAFACTKKSSKIKIIEKPKNATAVAEDILAMEAQLESKKDILKKWVEDNGELVVNGERFAFFPVEKTSVDIVEFVHALNKNNKEPWPYLQGNTKKIKALCKDDAGIANDVSQAITMSTSLRFSHKGDK